MTEKIRQHLSRYPKRKIALKRLFPAFAFALMFSFIPFIIDTVSSTYIKHVIEAKDVFVYKKVSPVTPISDLEKPLLMNSLVTWFKVGGDVSINDVLICNEGGRISEQSIYQFNFTPEKIGTEYIDYWQYNGRLPDDDNVCSIKKTVRYCFTHLNDPVCKTQTFTSEPIIFEKNEE